MLSDVEAGQGEGEERECALKSMNRDEIGSLVLSVLQSQLC